MPSQNRHRDVCARSGGKPRSQALEPPHAHTLTNYFTSPTCANATQPRRTDNTPELSVQNPTATTTVTTQTLPNFKCSDNTKS